MMTPIQRKAKVEAAKAAIRAHNEAKGLTPVIVKRSDLLKKGTN